MQDDGNASYSANRNDDLGLSLRSTTFTQFSNAYDVVAFVQDSTPTLQLP